MNTNTYPVMEFEQPAAVFYTAVIPAKEIINRVDIKYRSNGGIQRDADEKRVSDIAKYLKRPDAALPTPIVISCYQQQDTLNFVDNGICFSKSKNPIGHIVDGQHRILGLRRLSEDELAAFDLLVVFVIETSQASDAALFITINSNQKQVTKSLIYDLFPEIKGESDETTAHEIATLLNSDENSPFYKKIKMLGRKTEYTETISQAAFIDGLLPHIRNNGCLSKYNNKDKKHLIYKVIFNCFSALRHTFTNEWDNKKIHEGKIYILSKAIGYGGVIKALPKLIEHGSEKNDLSVEMFEKIFTRTKSIMQEESIEFTKDYFQSSNSGMIKIKDLIVRSI